MVGVAGARIEQDESIAIMTGRGARATGSRRRAAVLTACLLAGVFGLAVSPILEAQRPPPNFAYPHESLEQLEQLVAPIALYPDSLIAEILAASTFPTEVVEADRWLRAHRNLSGPALADGVDRQPWDDSVKALTAFGSVLGNMDRNLSWTSALGEAYYSQPKDVMAAVQAMRARARAAGNLRSTPEQAVATDGADISIAPVSPDFVYVPAYDPWIVYGAPVEPWPEWYEYPGIWLPGAYVSFAAGFSVGFVTGFEWGWHHWGCDWRDRYVSYDHGRYLSGGAALFHHRDDIGAIETRPRMGGHRHDVRQGAHPKRDLADGLQVRGGHRDGAGTSDRLESHHRVGRGYRLGPRYEERPANHGGTGYRLRARERHIPGYPLGPRYRRGHAYQLGPRRRTGAGYPLHIGGATHIAPRRAMTRPPALRITTPRTAPHPPPSGPRAGGEFQGARNHR
jgi:Protein of unknown function (DUF3300)